MLPARDNPFEADRIERLLVFEPVWLGLSWEVILERAEESRFRGALIGPHGSGKTTCCDALAARLERRGFRVIRWFLNDEKPRPDSKEKAAVDCAEEPPRTILIIDGAECIDPRSWRALCRVTAEFAGLLITAHHEKTRARLRLPVLLRTETNADMLIDFVHRLAPEADWDENELRTIFDQCNGNLRESLWVCYDRAASG